jgi:oligopeptide/dipeptide ABC transporter ATP-binding protein
MMQNGILMNVRDLRVHFFTRDGVVKAVDGVTFSIQSGRTLCVVGESGSGKSVTARALLNIIAKPGEIISGEMLYHYPDGQTIDVAQLDPRSQAIRDIRGSKIAMIFQEPMTSLSPLYTVGNQIVEAIRMHNDIGVAEAKAQAVERLREVGIPKPEERVNEYPFRLSGGMRQRCMIAMALSCSPSLLIADEPTTALDVTTQAQILDLMLSLQENYGMAILFITHDLGVVAEIADDVVVMYLGNVVEYSDVDTIFHNPQHPYTQALLRSIPKIGPTRQRLDAIRGMVPSPYARPGGCPFHTRCDKFMEGVCDRVEPETMEIGSNHKVRCLLHDARYAGVGVEGK